MKLLDLTKQKDPIRWAEDTFNFLEFASSNNIMVISPCRVPKRIFLCASSSSITPTGWNKVTLNTQLPSGWNWKKGREFELNVKLNYKDGQTFHVLREFNFFRFHFLSSNISRIRKRFWCLCQDLVDLWEYKNTLEISDSTFASIWATIQPTFYFRLEKENQINHLLVLKYFFESYVKGPPWTNEYLESLNLLPVKKIFKIGTCISVVKSKSDFIVRFKVAGCPRYISSAKYFFWFPYDKKDSLRFISMLLGSPDKVRRRLLKFRLEG